MTRRLTLQIAQKLAEKNNGKCLSDKYQNVCTKMLWQCEKRHKWEARYDDIRQGQWCPYCAGKAKNTLQDAKKLAEKNNGKCLSNRYTNNHTKMNWQCDNGHKWKARYTDILRGRWCPNCSGNIKNTIQNAQNLAKEKNGKCLSKEYTNAHTKMNWQCEEVHMWSAIYNSIQQGNWCPKCKIKKTQKKLTKILQEIMEESPITIRPEWLKNPETDRSLEIDIYFPEHKIAIEYNGEQHYQPVDFAGKGVEWAEQNLKIIQRRDRIKYKLIKQNPDKVKYFIIFTYKDAIEEENIKNTLIKMGAL